MTMREAPSAASRRSGRTVVRCSGQAPRPARAGHEAGLVDVEGNRALTPIRWRCSARRATDRSSPVDQSRSSAGGVGLGGDGLCFGEQFVGRAVLRRDDDDEPLVRVERRGGSGGNAAAAAYDALVAQHRAADLEDTDCRHDENAPRNADAIQRYREGDPSVMR